MPALFLPLSSLPEISLPFGFRSASLPQLAHYAAYLRLYP